MPVPMNNKQIQRSSMRDEVYNTLLEWIMEGVLKPGEKLLDKELAESLGVSRTPVREALRRLEDKDLVEASASRWTRVAKISIAEADLIYPIIASLEKLAVSMALPKLTPQDFAEMEKANADLKEAIAEGFPVKASNADSNFHGAILKRSENPHLAKILQDLKIKHRLLELLFFKGCACVSDSVAEHQMIIDALKAKDLDRVLTLIEHNWVKTIGNLKKFSCDELS